MVSVFIYSSGFGLQTPYSFHFAEFIDTIYPQRVFTTFELINCYGTRSRWLFFSLDCFIDAIFLHLMTKCFALTLILFLSLPLDSSFCWKQAIIRYVRLRQCSMYHFVTSRFIRLSTRSLLFQLIMLWNVSNQPESTIFIAADIVERRLFQWINERKKNKRRTFQFEIYRLSYTYQTAGIKAKHVWNISIRCIIYSAQTISCRFYRLNSLTVELK